MLPIFRSCPKFSGQWAQGLHQENITSLQLGRCATYTFSICILTSWASFCHCNQTVCCPVQTPALMLLCIVHVSVVVRDVLFLLQVSSIMYSDPDSFRFYWYLHWNGLHVDCARSNSYLLVDMEQEWTAVITIEETDPATQAWNLNGLSGLVRLTAAVERRQGKPVKLVD